MNHTSRTHASNRSNKNNQSGITYNHSIKDRVKALETPKTHLMPQNNPQVSNQHS